MTVKVTGRQWSKASCEASRKASRTASGFNREVTNLCKTTVVLSDQEVECELLPALGSHVDVYLQYYTEFTPRLAVLETERISVQAASIDLTAHNITFEVPPTAAPPAAQPAAQQAAQQVAQPVAQLAAQLAA